MPPQKSLAGARSSPVCPVRLLGQKVQQTDCTHGMKLLSVCALSGCCGYTQEVLETMMATGVHVATVPRARPVYHSLPLL